MKRILGIAAALTFVIAAYAVYAQTASAPKSTAAPAVPAVLMAPAAGDVKAAEPKNDATVICKKKGLAGEALDECVRNEILKIENAGTPANPTAEGRLKTEN